jgi:hypothetical protein
MNCEKCNIRNREGEFCLTCWKKKKETQHSVTYPRTEQVWYTMSASAVSTISDCWYTFTAGTD